jgi:hypothetical protein
MWIIVVDNSKKFEMTPTKDVSQSSTKIDENINKALKALKSPRLSVPQSNEKSNSNNDSSRKSAFVKEGPEFMLEEEYITRHVSAALPCSNLSDYNDYTAMENYKSATHK